MTDAQSHAARLREMADNTMLGSCGTPTQSQINDQAALLAGAEALEAQGRWHVSKANHKWYFVPLDKWAEWKVWFADAEAGEHTSIVPEWAEDGNRFAMALDKWLNAGGWKKAPPERKTALTDKEARIKRQEAIDASWEIT